MAELHAITPERHANKRWHKSANYNFAKQETAAVLLANELPAALLTTVTAFRPMDESYVPVAVHGLRPGQNLFVGPKGEWLGNYLPLIYRHYPFRLGNKNETEKFLCLDESSGVITNDTTGHAFFTDAATPAPEILSTFKALVQIEHDKEKTRRLCDLLNSNGLIEKWPIKVKNEKGTTDTITGLYRINETTLNTLPADKLVELRDCGALLLAYCQLLSMRNLATLATPQIQQTMPPANAARGKPEIKVTDDNGIISFDNL